MTHVYISGASIIAVADTPGTGYRIDHRHSRNRLPDRSPTQGAPSYQNVVAKGSIKRERYFVIDVSEGDGDGMLDTVKTLLFRGDGRVAIHECRRCGTSVESAEAKCPACDSDDIVTLSTN